MTESLYLSQPEMYMILSSFGQEILSSQICRHTFTTFWKGGATPFSNQKIFTSLVISF